MTSLRRFKNPMRPSKIKAKERPTSKPNKELGNLKSLKSPKRLEKKKKNRKKKQEQREVSTLTSKTNMTLAKKKNGQSRSQQRPNLNQIIYYNCDKKGHYAHKCPEPKK